MRGDYPGVAMVLALSGDKSVIDAGHRALERAEAFFNEGWRPERCSTPGVQVWRKAAAEVYGGYVPPYKSQGTIRGVPPVVMLRQILHGTTPGEGKWKEGDTGLKCKPSVRLVDKPDWQTEVWYEHFSYPWPVTDREYVYVEAWKPIGSADSSTDFQVVRAWLEHEGAPQHPDRVLLKAFVAMEIRASGPHDTTWGCAMEFNLGGLVPNFFVEQFLSEQPLLYDASTELFSGSESDGQLRSGLRTGAALMQLRLQQIRSELDSDPAHPLHGNSSVEALLTTLPPDSSISASTPV